MTGAQFRTEILVLEGGERFPLLVNRNTGLPEGFATDYSITHHRGEPIATTKRTMDAIGMFKGWAVERGINLDERFGTLGLFSSDEITSLTPPDFDIRFDPSILNLSEIY